MSSNIFGTDGIRGRFAEEPLTVPKLEQLGHAIAQWAINKYGPACSILLAQDTRISSNVVKASLESGLLLYPVHLHDTQILPVPALASLMKKEQSFDCGIMISASHNLYQDNGIKIIDNSGKLSIDDEHYISELFYNQISTTDYETLGTMQYQNMEKSYIDYLSSFFINNFLSGKKIVLDCANGATHNIAPKIFTLFGAQTIPIFDKPNGLNINKQCGALQPDALQKAVIAHQADIGFAFDGDGDRVIAVNRYGTIKDGDDILSILSTHPQYSSNIMVVGTIMSNQAFEIHLKKQKKELLRTAVGDKYVAEKLVQHNTLIGGEPSGHIILRDYLETGDGIFTALRTSEALSLTNNWNMLTFNKFPQIHATIPIKNKKDLTLPPFSDIIAAGKSQLHVGRVVVRYSGTEPILRIMIEDDDGDHAQVICSMIAQEFRKKLSIPEIIS